MLNRRLSVEVITAALSLALLMGLSLPSRAQENPTLPTEQQQQQTEPPKHQDAPAPEPHPELKPLMDAIPKLMDERKYADALQQADALLQQATEKGNKIGQAYAHRFRAWALQLQNRLEEALSAWEQAERLWREIGDGAFLVEALLGRAFCLWRADEAQAKQLIEQALKLAKAETRRSLAVALALNNLGADWFYAGVLAVAQQCWEQALSIRERLAPNSLEVAATLHNLGVVALEQGDLARAQQCLEPALAIREHLAPNSLSVADTLGNLGLLANRQGGLEQAQQYFESALALYERLAPNSLKVAVTLYNLGVVVYKRGDLAGTQRYYEQALALFERLAPNSLEVARTLGNLGVVARDRGDLAGAQRYYEQALALFERLTPNSLSVALTLNNLGSVTWNQGDLAGAQRYYEQALALYEHLDPNSLGMANTLINLGTVATNWGDLAGAQRYYEQALALFERLAPNSLEVASTLNNLGIVMRDRGDLAGAQRYYEQALAIKERLAPNSMSWASTLANLGVVARDRGDLADAQRYYEQALALFERLAPNSLEVARMLNNLGLVASDRGDLDGAQQYFESALALYERLAPNSLEVAGTLSNLAQLALNQKQLRAALQRLQKAIAIIETQRQTLTDPETRALFAEHYFSPYFTLARAYLQLNQPAQAAEILERSRARSLAETLQQRQLAFAENTPKPLRQLLQQQQQLNTKRQQTYRQLQQTDPKDTDTIAQLQRTLREIDQQQLAMDERLRKEFPDYANLVLPKPLTIQQIQQSLDTGTVLLYHALAEDHLLIVAVSRTQVKGVTRKVDDKQLEEQVKTFHRLVSRTEDLQHSPILPPRSESERRELTRQAQQLYNQLIAPVQEMLQNAQRVLLCPDGVLSQLPWASLIVKTENGKPVYWIERVALHITPSVGVYRQARAVQPVSQGAAIAAVWRYGGVDLAQNRRSEVATLLRRSGAGTVLSDLPNVEQEVKALRGLFGKGVRVAVNAQATPQRARQLAASARVVHFACHAKADNADPLNSALLLAPAGSDVGRLTAGEVLLNWRLRADLVMLSACETGLGAARRYEGVYSLGRAFLTAGSRSVGMSLWEVSDEATVALMQGFYSRYARGMAKDAALREAQLELLRTRRYADPYFWSAFVLMGDCRQAGGATVSQPLSPNRGATAAPQQRQAQRRTSSGR